LHPIRFTANNCSSNTNIIPFSRAVLHYRTPEKDYSLKPGARLLITVHFRQPTGHLVFVAIQGSFTVANQSIILTFVERRSTTIFHEFPENYWKNGNSRRVCGFASVITAQTEFDRSLPLSFVDWTHSLAPQAFQTLTPETPPRERAIQLLIPGLSTNSQVSLH